MVFPFSVGLCNNPTFWIMILNEELLTLPFSAFNSVFGLHQLRNGNYLALELLRSPLGLPANHELCCQLFGVEQAFYSECFAATALKTTP